VARDVFILGAGFSKAIYSGMPLLRELGMKALTHLSHDAPYIPPGLDPTDFEGWLSYLSDDQPWLLPEESLRNRAGFLRISRLISDIISEHESEAKRRPMPDWLCLLITYWHQTKSTVLTFNYDLLVEAAFENTVRVYSRPGDQQNYVNARQIITAPLMPAGARQGAVLAASTIESFQLMKLHGSRSWVYSGRESFYGEVIYDATTEFGWNEKQPHWIDRLIVDKVPLVVPPTNGKSNFFNNETVRSQWRLSLEALRHADRVFVVGYSFPSTDHMTRYLLQESHHADRKVILVSRSTAAMERLPNFIPTESIDTPIIGDRAVHELAYQFDVTGNEAVAYAT